MTKSLLFLAPTFILIPCAALCKVYSKALVFNGAEIQSFIAIIVFPEVIQNLCRLFMVNAVGPCKCLYELGKQDLDPSFQRRVLIHETFFEMPLLSDGR